MADLDVPPLVFDLASPDNLTTEMGPATTTSRLLLESCPIWSDQDVKLLHEFSFWVEGVCQG